MISTDVSSSAESDGSSSQATPDPSVSISPPPPSPAPIFPPPVHLASTRSSLILALQRMSVSEPPPRPPGTRSATTSSRPKAPPSIPSSGAPSPLSFLSAASTIWGEDSQAPAAKSSGVTFAPVKSFRASSSNSPLYMINNPSKSTRKLPFEEPNVNDADFANFSKSSREKQMQHAPGLWKRVFLRILYVLIILAIIYFVFVGFPLWPGTVVLLWRFLHNDESHRNKYALIGIILAGTIRNFLPLLTRFDASEPASDPEKPRDASECCIVIPCYKSAETLRSTLPACLAIFKPEQIFVVANGNSPTPLDHTADVCAEYGVRHIWVPVGSKITAEFVGVALADQYKYCMLIDDDVILPPNMPLRTEVFGNCASNNKVACIGYTIKSVGANSEPGTIMQQVQDIEYKIAGLTKVFQSRYGSTTFPHGAVALWRRDILMQVFHAHPGYHISEDWYLGHTARAAGYRIVMNSQVFVETETPPRLFPAIFSKQIGSRAGYGEMSIFKQRFYRWNFFFLYRVWSNAIYMIFSWRLGWRELVTKLWVLGECYDSLVMLLAPIMFPIALAVSWHLTLLIGAALLTFNFLLVCIFNIAHLGWLRRNCGTNERIAWKAFLPYMFLKFVMVYVNVASIYWSIYAYARFFTQQNLRVTESVAAWQVIRSHIQRPANSLADSSPLATKPQESDAIAVHK